MKSAAAVDHVPELGGFLKGFIFAEGEFGAIEKILERVLVQHTVDAEALFRQLEINAIILRAITEQLATFAGEASEFLRVDLVEILGEEIKFTENLQLEGLGQGRHLGGAGIVENNLEHGCDGQGVVGEVFVVTVGVSGFGARLVVEAVGTVVDVAAAGFEVVATVVGFGLGAGLTTGFSVFFTGFASALGAGFDSGLFFVVEVGVMPVAGAGTEAGAVTVAGAGGGVGLLG